jgi:hypothetical protein
VSGELSVSAGQRRFDQYSRTKNPRNAIPAHARHQLAAVAFSLTRAQHPQPRPHRPLLHSVHLRRLVMGTVTSPLQRLSWAELNERRCDPAGGCARLPEAGRDEGVRRSDRGVQLGGPAPACRLQDEGQGLSGPQSKLPLAPRRHRPGVLCCVPVSADSNV